MKLRLFIIAVLCSIFTVSVFAQDAQRDAVSADAVPPTLFYQGYATAAGGAALPTGSYEITFALYTVASGGIALWQESHPAVMVKSGMFSAVLGNGSPAQPLTVAFDQQYYLGIKIGADPEFSPRILLTSAPYSFHARTAENADLASNVPDGAITAAKIAAGAINTAMITDNSITTSKIVDGSITASKIPSFTLVTSINSIQDDLFIHGGTNVTVTQQGNTLTIDAPDRLSGVEHDATLSGDGTGSNKLSISDGSITASKIASGAVNTAAITDNSITSSKIVDGSITASKIPSFTLVTSINSIQDDLFIYGGDNVTVTAKNNTLTISTPDRLGSVQHDGTLFGDGTGTSPLGIAFPFTNASASSKSLIEIGQSGSGGGIQSTSTTGNAGKFVGSATPAGAAALLVQTTGLGMAGRFEIDNAANNSAAVWGQNNGTGKAGYFVGNVQIVGTLAKSSGTFMIDHPLDPANKYLYHSFVESPDMMNIYKGTARLDARGEATVTLPSYFEALNMDFDYQLTAIGAPMPNLYVASEISGNTFKIAGGVPNAKASWLVTAVRNDPYAQEHRVVPEVDKEPENRGSYLNPLEWKQPMEKGISRRMQPELSEQEEMTSGLR
ncbi:MAG: hypothetical protein WBQ23_10265 [Bacteroidota bacterium]